MFRSKMGRRKRTSYRKRQEAELRAKSGPVTVRFVDPKTLRQGQQVALKASKPKPTRPVPDPFAEAVRLLRKLKNEAYKEDADEARIADLELRIDRLLLGSSS